MDALRAATEAQTTAPYAQADRQSTTPTANSNSDSPPTTPFVSQFRIDGQPILPPLVSRKCCCLGAPPLKRVNQIQADDRGKATPDAGATQASYRAGNTWLWYGKSQQIGDNFRRQSVGDLRYRQQYDKQGQQDQQQ